MFIFYFGRLKATVMSFICYCVMPSGLKPIAHELT